MQRWTPFVTVAAVVERDSKFLMVEERIDGQLCYNQPAGHWEDGESLLQAVQREVLEETAWQFQPETLLGVYRWQHSAGKTFLRFAFIGDVKNHQPDLALDAGIERAVWMSLEEIENCAQQHRSPQVLHCVRDYLRGQRFPLECLITVD